MIRQFWPPLSLALLLSCATAPCALAGDGDDANSVMADCGGADLPASAVDSCLERARVLDETDPSPRLQSLEASLEERETGQAKLAGPEAAALPTPDRGGSTEAQGYDSVMSPPGEGLQPDAADPDQASPVSPTARTTDNAAPQNPQNGDSATAGAMEPDADDEPPIADPPDSDSPGDRTTGDSSSQSDDPQ